jgi:hypothetical protein
MKRPKVDYVEDTSNEVLRVTFAIRFTAEQFRAVPKEKLAALMTAVSDLTLAAEATKGDA